MGEFYTHLPLTGRVGLIGPSIRIAERNAKKVFRLRASVFLCRQKVTKELSKGRGVSISLSPLKSPLLKTTNQGGFGPPIGCTPRGLAVP